MPMFQTPGWPRPDPHSQPQHEGLSLSLRSHPGREPEGGPRRWSPPPEPEGGPPRTSSLLSSPWPHPRCDTAGATGIRFASCHPMRSNALQCTPMHSNALQCAPMRSNALQCAPMRSNALQCTPMHSNALQSDCLESTPLPRSSSPPWPHRGRHGRPRRAGSDQGGPPQVPGRERQTEGGSLLSRPEPLATTAPCA